MEYLKKLATEHTVTLAELNQSATYAGDVKITLKKWMEAHGVDWESDGDARDHIGSPSFKRNDGKFRSEGFEGSNPIGWIERAEKFFEVHQIPATEKLKLAFVSMDGAAASWESLTTALIRRFGDRMGGNVFERLATIKQDGAIEDYVKSFELLVAQSDTMQEDQLLG